jgi:hypothetical protein
MFPVTAQSWVFLSLFGKGKPQKKIDFQRERAGTNLVHLRHPISLPIKDRIQNFQNILAQSTLPIFFHLQGIPRHCPFKIDLLPFIISLISYCTTITNAETGPCLRRSGFAQAGRCKLNFSKPRLHGGGRELFTCRSGRQFLVIAAYLEVRRNDEE